MNKFTTAIIITCRPRPILTSRWRHVTYKRLVSVSSRSRALTSRTHPYHKPASDNGSTYRDRHVVVFGIPKHKDRSHLIVCFGRPSGEDFVAKLLALTSLYWLQTKTYFVKCLIFNIVYILSYPTIEIVKEESHSGTADITTFYHTSKPTSSKTVFKQMFAYVHLALFTIYLVLYTVFVLFIL